jgi:hypothetical protein
MTNSIIRKIALPGFEQFVKDNIDISPEIREVCSFRPNEVRVNGMKLVSLDE